MAFCGNCGAQIGDDEKICPYCRTPVAGPPEDDEPQQQTGTDYFPQLSDPVPQQEMGLKWAHFLCYFALWMGAISDFLSAIGYFTGSVYNSLGDGITAELVYAFYGNNLLVLDKLVGAALLGSVALHVAAALSIIKYKTYAGKLVCAGYALGAVVVIAYLGAVSMIVGSSAFDAQTITQVVVDVVMIFVNYTYFKNRSHIFVN